MKQSHIDWCPMIPDHWEEKRIKDMAFLQSGNSITAMDFVEDGKYPVYGGNGLRGYTNSYTNDGDFILIGRQGALCGNINYAHGKFFASEHAVIVYPRKEEVTFWLGETLRTADLNRLSMTAAQPGLAVGTLNLQFIPYPPKEERIRIAKYLDTKLSEISHQVSILTSKRDAYLRLKKSIINNAVTHGLNPNVKMKDSGVEWIGEIPEHWEVKRIKDIGKLKLGKMLTTQNRKGLYLKLFLKARNIGWGNLILDSIEEMYFSASELNDLRIRKGDLLFTEGGEVGKTSIWNDEIPECYLQNSVQKLTVKKEYYSKYYLYLSMNYGAKGYYNSIVNLVSIKHLTNEKLRQVKVLVPPLPEQHAIAAYLDDKCAKIDALVANLDKQISRYGELKRSLIDEVITGKRAV